MEHAPSINRILLPGQEAAEAPSIPESFREQLRQYDPSLCISWNTHRKRFVIEQCVQHFASGGEHSHLCQRLYVLLVQDPEGCMLSLSEKVLSMIAERDVAKAGYGPNDLDRWIADSRRKRQETYAASERQHREITHDATKDGRRQLLKAVHLMQQHNLTPNR